MRRAVQALIVALILLIVAGLVLPCVVNVREAAVRMQCQNNLKILGTSTVSYQEFHEHFPPAGMPNPALPPEKRLSWLVAILPYVEADPTYSQMARDKGWDAKENRFAALRDWPIFRCPASPDRPPPGSLMPSHYLGFSGLGPDALSLPPGDPKAGFLGYERVVRLEDVADPANFALASETDHSAGTWIAAGPPTARALETPPYLGPGAPFGGNHRRGANVAFADGSVRFLPLNTDSSVLDAMVRVKTRPLPPPER